jgi:DNA primase
MPFPEHFIEQLRQRVDLVELIGEVVPLKRVGRNYAGLCPFHSEDTPSFFVHPEWGIFKCFGCGKGGNALTFVMEYYRMSFPEAVRFLAQRVGLPLPEEAGSEGREESGHVQMLYRAMQAAAQFYQETLWRAEGEQARRYAFGRGLKSETLRAFGIGYAPEGWDALLQYLRQRGFPDLILEEAGLVSRSERGTLYDRFRHRLVFPIHDPIGRVVGFGARRLRQEEATPKYLNSPATPIYDKSRQLYGLYHARQALRAQGYAVLVEGYMDVLSLHQVGITTAVATAGTALTREQLQLLRRYCQQLFVVYDADRAGQEATLRALELALREGFEVKIVLLPEGEDPDSFVQSQGGEAFRLRLRHAVPFLDFVLLRYQQQGLLQTPEGQAQAVRHVVRLIAAIPDRLLHDFLIRHIALRFGLPEAVLYEELGHVRQAEKAAVRAPAVQQSSVPMQPRASMPKLLPEEEQLLRIVVLSPELRRAVEQHLEGALLSEPARRLWEFLRRLGADPLSAVVAEAELQEQEEAKLLLELAFVREAPSPSWKRYLQGEAEFDARRLVQESLMRLRLRAIEEQLRRLHQHHGQSHSWEEQRRVLEQIQQLAAERQALMQQLSEHSA